jgi:two-component system LytT family response regulator
MTRLAPGSMLGPYEILDSLGAGSMGEVYRARDPRLGREVALKVLPAGVASHQDRLARFEREAKAVAALNHPHIVTIHSIEEAGGVRFLTMELIEGECLDRLIVSGGLPLERVLELTIPLADALAAAHEKAIVHRDLKPGNVMVTHDGWVKVLDFGLAKASPREPAAAATQALTVASPISTAGLVVGTAPYMAPEQLRGEEVDARADLFAFGVMLFELVSGRRPFEGPTVADVSSAILRDPPHELVSARGSLPPDLQRLIARSLEKDRELRIQTARDVRSELQRVQRQLASAPVGRRAGRLREPGTSGVIRALIVDDEPPARSLLHEYLGRHADVEVLGECENGFEAVKRVPQLRPDLVFLDVRMPKLDGFEVLELLDPQPAVVFATAFDEYALKAFEVHAVDYLLKPYSPERLAEALERVRERLRASGGAESLTASIPAARLAADARPKGQHLERVLIKDGAQVHVIPVETIDYLEAQDDYVAIHVGAKSHLKPQPLAELETLLDPAQFVRVHRSIVMNVTRLSRLEPFGKDSRVAILADGRQLPVSRAGYARLKELL